MNNFSDQEPGMRSNDFSPSQQSESSDHNFFMVAQQLRNVVDFEPYEFRTRRNHARSTRSISVSVQPLDADFQPTGDMFWVVSRDISISGMGLICHEPITCEHIRVGLMNEHVTAISQVRHNTSIGEKYPLYLVGIEFLHDH
jgi:hypothetical protein